MGDHEPVLYRAGRWGSWCHCTCGAWRSRTWSGVVGAHLEFGRHLLGVAKKNDRPRPARGDEPLGRSSPRTSAGGADRTRLRGGEAGRISSVQAGFGVRGAFVGVVCFHQSVQIAASPGLLDDLAAASEDAESYHHDLCQQFDTDAPGVCTCGAPALLRRLAAMVGVGSSWPLEAGPMPARTL